MFPWSIRTPRVSGCPICPSGCIWIGLTLYSKLAAYGWVQYRVMEIAEWPFAHCLNWRVCEKVLHSSWQILGGGRHQRATENKTKAEEGRKGQKCADVCGLFSARFHAVYSFYSYDSSDSAGNWVGWRALCVVCHESHSILMKNLKARTQLVELQPQRVPQRSSLFFFFLLIAVMVWVCL